MKSILALILITVTAPALSGNSFIPLDAETGLPLPAGWHVIGTPAEYPVAIASDETQARLLIFRTLLPADERIAGIAEFRASVNRVLDSVVLQLPEAVLLTSTGNHEANRAQFVVEFQTTDTALGEFVRHRLAGILYSHPDDYQLLYSLWGQAPLGLYPTVEHDFEIMQAGFRYSGPQEDRVFPSGSNRTRWSIVLIVLLAAVYLVVRQRRRLAFREPKSVLEWICACGYANTARHDICRQCGQPRVKIPSA